MKSNIHTGREALRGMLDGMKLASNAIRLTYGAKGCNSVIEQDFYPFNIVANDAQSMIQAMDIEDTLGKRGLQFYKELCDKAEKDSGDGRKTTLIIAEEIMERGYDADISGMQLKHDLDALLPLIENSIDAQKKPITVNEVESVATIASESPVIGKLIGDVYNEIGLEGVIQPEYVLGQKGHNFKVKEGVRFQQTGYLTDAMCYDEEARQENRKETRAVYENPVILVTKRKIEKLADINPLIKKLESLEKRNLVIFTSDMDSNVASIMVTAHKNPAIYANITIIKAPVVWKDYVYEDFAKCVGATIVEDATGVNFKNLDLKHLGTCGKIEITKDETILLGTQDITEHLQSLKAEGSNDSLLRLSWLTTKTAILKIGADSESELAYFRLKTSDAINSSRLALIDGVVSGGGFALFNASNEIPDTIAGRIMSEALKAPLKQNCFNLGVDIGETFGENVVDAAKVQKNAVKNALSIASTLLTTSVIITKIPKTPEQIAQEIMSKSGQRPFGM